MRPGDRLVCVLVEPLLAGQTFKQWPLHVTIVPWFRTEVETHNLNTEFKKLLSEMPAFEVSIGKTTQFGYRKDKTVALVRLPNPLTKIERMVRRALKSHKAWLADETTKSRRGYRPHVTDQTDKCLRENDKFYCDRLYTIEQKGDYKEVVAEVKLDHGETKA